MDILIAIGLFISFFIGLHFSVAVYVQTEITKSNSINLKSNFIDGLQSRMWIATVAWAVFYALNQV